MDLKKQNMSNIDYRLNNEVNTIFRIGSLIMMFVSFAIGLILVFLHFNGTEKNIYLTVLIFSFGIFFFIINLLAARNKIKGYVQYIVSAILMLLPLCGFVITHLRYNISGTGVSIATPFSFMLFSIVIITGFFFNVRLSVIYGVISGIAYIIAYVLSRPYYLEIYALHPNLEREFSVQYAVMKTIILVVAGGLTGIIASTARKLIYNILEEEKEKNAIGRLFGQYVSPEVKEKIIKERKDAIAEKEQVVVLFSDIRSFTNLSEQSKPEELVMTLNDYFDHMVKAITANQGIVDKFIGDAVMAVFGGLIKLDNPCDAALNAAIQMRGELAIINKSLAEKNFPNLENGIGLHYGEVIQGTIGSLDRKEFTVIGDTVNTAARVEKFTKKYNKILLTDSVYKGLSPAMQTVCLKVGNANLRGKSEPVMMYGCGE